MTMPGGLQGAGVMQQVAVGPPFTTPQVAELTGVPEYTLRRWCTAGYLNIRTRGQGDPMRWGNRDVERVREIKLAVEHCIKVLNSEGLTGYARPLKRAVSA